MKILVTGAKGFVAKNLISQLRNEGYVDIFYINVSLLKFFIKSNKKGEI